MKDQTIIYAFSAAKRNKTLVDPHFMYRCSVWYGLIYTLNDKLQKLQNRGATVIAKSRYDASIDPFLALMG